MGKFMRKFVLQDSSSDRRMPPVACLAQRRHARELASAAAQEQKPPSTFAPPIRRVRRPPVQSEVATSFPTASCTCSTSLRRRPAAGPSPPSDCSSGHPPPALAALQASPRHGEPPRHLLLVWARPNRPGRVAPPQAAALLAAGEAPVTLGSRATAQLAARASAHVRAAS
jgi:hypothetical protein